LSKHAQALGIVKGLFTRSMFFRVSDATAASNTAQKIGLFLSLDAAVASDTLKNIVRVNRPLTVVLYGESIQQRKTQFNVRHSQLCQTNEQNIIFPPPFHKYHLQVYRT
jgi:hypothetical protein